MKKIFLVFFVAIIINLSFLSFPLEKVYATESTLTIGLAYDTPQSATAIANICYPFTKISLTASGGDVIISQIQVKRMGLSYDSAFDSISLVDADNNCSFGSTEKLNNGIATFNEIIIVKAGKTRKISLKGNTAYSLVGHTGETASLSLSSITIDDDSNLNGTLPITGNSATLNGAIRQNPGQEQIYGYEFLPPSQCTPVSSLSTVTNDPLTIYQKYFENINIRKTWSFTMGSHNVIVAVIDSGIYINHPDLSDNIWKNAKEIEGNGVDDDKNGYVDDIFGWNFVDNNNQMDITFDKDDHGTMVAGIIGAKGNNNIGITGINQNVKLMPLLILTKYKTSNYKSVSDAIRYATDNGADIINLSFGTVGVVGYTTELDEAIKYAYENNVLMVAAAGNGDLETGYGQNLNFIKVSPVCNDNNKNMVLGVGALSETDNYSKPAWSNYGDFVDVWAPGENILTTSRPEYSNYQNYYFYGTGTSFAAPIVSGIAALIKAAYPDISNIALRDRIINSANGGLIVNAYKAIQNPLEASEKVNFSENVLSKEKSLVKSVDKKLSNRLRGKILLQIESKGEAWYVNPDDEKKYYLGKPADAFIIMRKLGLGISEKDFNSFHGVAPARLSGKILLRVGSLGEAYYVNPVDLKMHYLGKPADAFQIMRKLGLGITNTNIRKIDVGEVD